MKTNKRKISRHIQFSEQGIAFIERIKAEYGLTTDSAAIRFAVIYLYNNIKLRELEALKEGRQDDVNP